MDKDHPILVTGTAGFIGFHLSKRLLKEGYNVVGIDSLNDYYDVSLKHSRLSILKNHSGFVFFHQKLEVYDLLAEVFKKNTVKIVIHLAAQAGVRYSLTNPHAYVNANITGFLNVLEASRRHQVEHLLYASSSSVYGANTSMPFKVGDTVDHPLSLYAATKKSNELMAHTYAASFNVPVTGLRFFTVYGPWGRPDMALFLFTNAIIKDQPINVFNHGNMKRDFTYVDDIVEGMYRLMTTPPTKNENWDAANPNPASSFAPYQLFNIGNNSPVELMDYIKAIEEKLGKQAEKNFMPLQTGDVPETFAEVSDLEQKIAYKPSTSVREGVGKFIDWYKEYYKVK
ncbi:MAG: NAD-dependent epimerase [Bacteroidota bacterium]